MTKKILVIGCGNIGSRHIQALTKLPFKIDIDLVEPNKASQNLTKSRLDELQFNNINNLIWHNSIDESIQKSDLTIVSTTSIGRADLIVKLLERGHSRFLIEKIVCQSTKEYELLKSKFLEFDAKGWINTNRRYMEPYRQLKNLVNSGSFHMYVIAGDVGLGSSAYHFVDLFSWFSNDDIVCLNGDFLDKKISISKRGNNLLEFSGNVTCRNKNSSLIISFLPFINIPVTVGFVNNDCHIIIDETNKKVISIKETISLSNNFEMANVSNSTTHIVNDIIHKDKCDLPELNFGFNAHNELFNIFNKHILLCQGNKKTLCPIS